MSDAEHHEKSLEELPESSTDAIRRRVRRGRDGEGRFMWLVIAAAFAIVIVVTWRWTVWFGIAVSAVLGINAGWWYVNSTRYVRDAWVTRDQLRSASPEQKPVLELAERLQRDYQDVDRNFGIASLTASLIILGITTVIAI